MNIERVNEILINSIGQVDAVGQPVDGSQLYDFFVAKVVLNTDSVQANATKMTKLLKQWPSLYHGMIVPPLGKEVNYVMAGALLGDQHRAFMLFAFGKILDWWDILDPHTVMGVSYDDSMGHYLVSSLGLVSIIGFRA